MCFSFIRSSTTAHRFLHRCPSWTQLFWSHRCSMWARCPAATLFGTISKLIDPLPQTRLDAIAHDVSFSSTSAVVESAAQCPRRARHVIRRRWPRRCSRSPSAVEDAASAPCKPTVRLNSRVLNSSPDHHRSRKSTIWVAEDHIHRIWTEKWAIRFISHSFIQWWAIRRVCQTLHILSPIVNGQLPPNIMRVIRGSKVVSKEMRKIIVLHWCWKLFSPPL